MSSAVASMRQRQEESFFEKISKWTIYALFFFVPVFFLPWTTNILEHNKQLLFVVLTAVGLLAWLGQMVSKKQLVFKAGWLNLIPGLFFVALLVSSFLSLSGYQTWVGQVSQEYTSFLSMMLFVILFYVLVNTMGDKASSRGVLMAVLLSSVLSGILTLLGMFNLFHLPFAFAQSSGFNTIGTINGFVLFMVVMMFIGHAMWLVSQEGKDPIIPQSSKGILLRVLICLVSAIALIGLIALDFWLFWVITIVGVLLLGTFLFIGSRQVLHPVKFGIPLLVLVMSLLFVFLPTPLHLSLPVVVSPSFGTSWEITKSTLSARPQNLFFGSGPGTYLYDYLAYKPATVNNSQFWSMRFDRAKSSTLTLLASLGIVGTLLWFVLMIWVEVKTIGRLVVDRETESWKMTYVLFIGWSLLLMSHLFYSSNFTLQFLLWGFTGLLASQFMTHVWKSDFTQSPRLGLLASFAFAVVSVGVVASLFISGARYTAEVAFAKAVTIDKSETGTIQQVIDQLNRAVAFNGLSDVYQRNVSSAYFIQARELVASTAGEEERTAEETQKIVSAVTSSINAAKRATQIEPNFVANWVVLGSIYRDLMSFAQGAEDLAAQSFINTIQLEPINPVHRTNLGRVYLAVADRARALKTAEDPELSAQAAEQEASLLSTAEQVFLKAVELKSDYLPAHYYLAATYEREGKLEQATARLVALRNNNPADIGLAFQLTQMLIRLEKYDVAQQELERIVELNPTYSNALWYLASMYEISGDQQKAISSVEKVVQLNPTNQEARQRLQLLKSGQKTTKIPEPIQPGQTGATQIEEGEVVNEPVEAGTEPVDPSVENTTP